MGARAIDGANERARYSLFGRESLTASAATDVVAQDVTEMGISRAQGCDCGVDLAKWCDGD